MRIEIATLFPEMCEAVLSASIIGRARAKGAITVNCHQIRDYANNKHNRVDDAPFGGGMGMVMQAQPIYDCWNAVKAQSELPMHTIYLSPKGNVLTQQRALEMLQQREQVSEWVSTTVQERRRMMEAVQGLALCLEVYPSDANFFLMRVSDAGCVYNALLERGIIVRNRHSVQLCENCLRITIGSPQENAELLSALSEIDQNLQA